MKLRMPHLPGCDFKTSRQAGRTVAVRASFRAEDSRTRIHEEAGWLPHPPTQADADAATTRINNPEVMEVRRTRSILRRAAARKVTGLS